MVETETVGSGTEDEDGVALLRHALDVLAAEDLTRSSQPDRLLALDRAAVMFDAERSRGVAPVRPVV